MQNNKEQKTEITKIDNFAEIEIGENYIKIKISGYTIRLDRIGALYYLHIKPHKSCKVNKIGVYTHQVPREHIKVLVSVLKEFLESEIVTKV